MFSSGELAEWSGGEWSVTSEAPISGISHDTRTLKAGDVYIAIKGENHDGHDFIGQAVEKGAAGLIVEREFPAFAKAAAGRPNSKVPQLVVPDSMAALWQMAAGTRSTWTGTVVGITGSVGKTTVKEMLASVLAQKGTVAKTPGNWNNDIGLPLSMLAADRAADFFVFELGMNHPGEIDRLAGLLKPEWALITNIGKAHAEFFSGLDGIAKEKGAILNHALNALLDAGSEWFNRLQAGFQGRVITLTAELFSAPQPGAHMLQNARFAATLGLEVGLSPAEIQKGLDTFEPPAMRWEETEKNGIVFINDAYNANPLSMRAAISTFAELSCEGRKFVVLGGMRELGAESEAEHRALGGFVDTLKFDGVVTVGKLGAQIVCKGNTGVEKSTVVRILREQLRSGDRVLFKASRGEKLETILDEIELQQFSVSNHQSSI